MRKNLTTSLIIIVLLFLSAPVIQAKADSLIIQDDGTISLLITHNDVLGASEDKTKTKPSEPSSVPPLPSRTTEKSVTIAPAHTDSKITVTPPINNDNKIQVTITTTAPAQNPQSPAQSKDQSIPSNKTTEENVDQIVAQGTDEKPVLRITSPGAHELQITQQTVAVTTSLPLQIDSFTHSLGVSSANQPSKISVLPNEAVQGVINKGILNNKSLNSLKMNLTSETTGITYTIQSQRQGKMFGLFPVTTPVRIKLSAQSGKVVETSQSTLFTIFGGFIW